MKMKYAGMFCLDNELEKWFNKWHRKVVTGRCLIELKNMNKKYNKENPEKCLNAVKKWNKENPEKRKAQKLAQYNISIPNNQSCETCNKRLAKHKHHQDYSLPLKVNFLCIPCHNEIHRSKL